jgi:hypothetical protein
MGQVRFWPSAPSQEADCGSKRGNSPALVDTSYREIGIVFALLSGLEPTQMLPASKELFEPAVIAHDAVDDTSAAAHDLGGQ